MAVAGLDWFDDCGPEAARLMVKGAIECMTLLLLFGRTGSSRSCSLSSTVSNVFLSALEGQLPGMFDDAAPIWLVRFDVNAGVPKAAELRFVLSDIARLVESVCRPTEDPVLDIESFSPAGGSGCWKKSCTRYPETGRVPAP